MLQGIFNVFGKTFGSRQFALVPENTQGAFLSGFGIARFEMFEQALEFFGDLNILRKMPIRNESVIKILFFYEILPFSAK